eukprot:sb/3467210/
MTTTLPDEKAARTRELYDRISLGIVRSLEKRTGVTDVKLLDRKPADPGRICDWEQEHCTHMPEDLKNFYITTDGLLLCWSVKFNGSVIPLGRMEVNPLGNLKRIAMPGSEKQGATQSVTVTDTESDDETDRPRFSQIEKAFEIDACCSQGKVCLVYEEGVVANPKIWFLDRAVRWHFLASSFMEYFRLMVMHLGLPQWQYAFTDIGISPMSKQWFNLYAPVRLAIDDEQLGRKLRDTDADIVVADKSVVVGKIDIDRLFKMTNDKNRDKQPKKKPQPPPSPQNTTQKVNSNRPSLAHLASKRNNR